MRKGHALRNARSLAELLDEEWQLQDSLEQSRVGWMFETYGLAPPQRIIECASVVLFSELALNTDAVSYWSRRILGHVIKLGQELDLAEQVPPMNISLVGRDQELVTREAKALIDELVYAYRSPHASRSNEVNSPGK